MQKPFEVRGVIVPLLTPLSRDGEQVDERALQAHVEWLVKKGVHGLMPCGTTGEGPLLAQAEREIITEIVVDAAAGRVPVIAHVGAITTRRRSSWPSMRPRSVWRRSPRSRRTTSH